MTDLEQSVLHEVRIALRHLGAVPEFDDPIDILDDLITAEISLHRVVKKIERMAKGSLA